VWDGVTSAAGSDARKRDDGDAVASPRSDDAAFGCGGRFATGSREVLEIATRYELTFEESA
jgi:hypothetical protein